MIRVVVVDDHPVVLAGLSALIGADPDMEVVGLAGSVADALTLPAEAVPDLCVLDLRLPDGDGVGLGLRLRAQWPDVKLVILTMSREPATVLRSLADGVDSYLIKDSPPDELLGAIHATATGSVVLSSGASASVRVAASAVPDADVLARLDARDREILALLVQGLETHQVAARLFLAPKTIRNRISEMLAKLDVATREDAIALGRAGGLDRRP
ncbi:two-component system, NarL family, response regulator DevR [Nocardioides alpinus]|uniref:DNA-binding response regulator n=1 Tax=Nocardioides alpinus TaxID=748909 RepID=A0A1I0W265_9ACTN|nr:response regulator transcription factor [Nocardioides alpinus]PKH38058.1 DNA-binding response regulator [Nocardioides alpinus]SFA82799.1 two-component system, NarL family, response regulator DevR [Nocardioides alpinus]